METRESFYTRIGGEPAVAVAVAQLYRVLLADERLAPYFVHADLATLQGHMIALVSQVLGGPEQYSGRDLRTAHAGLGIAAGHYDLTAAYLIGILAGLAVDNEVLAAVRTILAGARDDVTG